MKSTATSKNGTDARKPSRFERVAQAPLRVITKIGGAELTDKLGLRKPVERVLFDIGKATAKMRTAPSSKAAVPTEDAARLARAADSGAFDLRPTEDQEELRKAARRFAEDVLRPAAHDADAAAAPPAELLERASELALAGLSVPEAFGGVAETRSTIANALVIEELARGDMGLALAMLAPLAVVNALVDWGTREQQQLLLPEFTGERFKPAAFALLEGRPQFDPRAVRTGAVRAKDGGFTLFGEKVMVPLATKAELFLVAAEIRGAGPRLFLVEADRAGLTVEATPSMGLRGAGLGRLKLDAVHVPADALLGGEEGALRELDFGAVVDRARVAWGAMAVGTAQAVLDHVIPYCNERKAFGEPITHRQSVAFMIADLAIEIEGMRLLVHRAASLAERGASCSAEAARVRVHTATKGMKVGTDGVQLLGGHGFVKDHPVERWYRDLRAIALMEGALLA